MGCRSSIPLEVVKNLPNPTATSRELSSKNEKNESKNFKLLGNHVIEKMEAANNNEAPQLGGESVVMDDVIIFPWLKTQICLYPLTLQISYMRVFGSQAPRFIDKEKSKKRNLQQAFVGGSLIQVKSRTSLDHMEPFQINESKLTHLIQNVKNNSTLTVFLSSPFLGCDQERIFFMKNFYPLLFYLCQRKGIFFSVFDLRWGITNEMTANHNIFLTCLSGIDKCDIFLGYFGARYGSSNLSIDPPSPGVMTWIDEEIAECSANVRYEFLSDPQYRDRSVTEFEFLHALTHAENYKLASKPISFIFYRDPSYDAGKFEAAQKAENESESRLWMIERNSAAAAASLKEQVLGLTLMDGQRYAALYDNYKDPNSGANLMYLCCERLISIVLAHLDDDIKNRSEAYKAHSAFAKSRLGDFVNFNEEFTRKLSSAVASATTPNRPIIITGASGGGKSSFVADFVMRRSTNSHVIFHFTGCTSESTSLRVLLHRQYDEFCALVAPFIESTRHVLNDVDEMMSLNDVWTAMIRVYNDVGLAPDLPMIMFVMDALNQLVDEPYDDESAVLPSACEWLPQASELPAKLKVVISCLPGDMMNGLQRLWPSGSFTEITLGPLDISMRQAFTFSYLDKYNKRADATYFDPLIKADQCKNPMFLSLALNYLVLHGSYNYFKKKGCSELIEAENVSQLMQYLIKVILEALVVNGRAYEHTVKNILSLIYCSRIGLSANEIVGLMQLDKYKEAATGTNGEAFDIKAWILLEHQLHQFIAPRNGFFNFTHDYVRQAVESICFKQDDQDLKIAYHKQLAFFFQIQIYSKEDLSLRHLGPSHDVRYHQKKSGQRPSVTVAVRVRPLNVKEIQGSQSSCVATKRNNLVLSNPTQGNAYDSFDFDHVFDSSDNTKVKTFATQQVVYDSIGEDIIGEAIEGVNGTILAYGQTSSGKSHTMIGTRDDSGLIYRFMSSLLYRLTTRETEEHWEWTAKCTLVEIYKNKGYDLLQSSVKENDNQGSAVAALNRIPLGEVKVECIRPSSEVLTLSEDEMASISFDEIKKMIASDATKDISSKKAYGVKTNAVETTWRGATEVGVRNYEQLESLLSTGLEQRRSASTLMNDSSSRSHCIFTVYISQEHIITKRKRFSKIHLVDLAGSERVMKSGIEFIEESIAINSSLTALNRCIRALSDPSVSHVPYRESLLTWFLQDSLGGNASTVFLATISPSLNNRSETLSTLQYANFAKKMSTNIDDAQMLKSLQDKSALNVGDVFVGLSHTKGQSSQYIFEYASTIKLTIITLDGDDIETEVLDTPFTREVDGSNKVQRQPPLPSYLRSWLLGDMEYTCSYGAKGSYNKATGQIIMSDYRKPILSKQVLDAQFPKRDLYNLINQAGTMSGFYEDGQADGQEARTFITLRRDPSTKQ